MKLTILLLLTNTWLQSHLMVGVCIVTAKYLPNERDNSGQLLSRYKRSDSDESDGSSEDEKNSNGNNDDDDDSKNDDEVNEQSKQIAKIEKMRQKLLEKQEKERKKQEEYRRKFEEKIAKELEKEEEKRQKEKRKQEEKLEKERKKLEEEQKKIQEKILENERKRQERIEKELEEIEKNTRKNQESSDSYADDSIKELLKIQIYSKYGINESNTNLEKKQALRRYLQEELGLNASSTESERRKAIFDLVQNKLQNATEINVLQNQLMEYVEYVGIQKIRGKIEKDIEKLQNKTETLNTVNSTWVPAAKQNIEEQVTFLETIKQILPNVMPSWLIGSQPQVNTPDSSKVDNKNLVKSLEISQDSNNLTREVSGLDIVTEKPTDNSSSNSVNNSGLGEVIEGAPNTPVSIAEVISKSANNLKEILNNGVSAIFSSPVVTETSYTDSELGQNLTPINVISSVNENSDISPLPETQNVINGVVSLFNTSPNQNAGVSSSDSNISNIVPVGTTTEYAQSTLTDTASSLNSADESSSLLPNPQSTKVSVLSGNNDQSFDSLNSSQISEVNPSLVPEINNKLADTQNIDTADNINTLSTISTDVAIGNLPVPIIDTIPVLNLAGDANLASVSSQPDLRNEASSLLSVTKDDSYASQNINSSPNNSSASNLLPGDTTTEFVSNLILDSVLSVNSASNTPFFLSSNNNVSSEGKNEINETETPSIPNIISEVTTTENVPNSIIEIILSENSSSGNSPSDLVSGNNNLPNDKEIKDSQKNSSTVVEVTTEYVQNPLDDIASIKLGSNINLPSSYLNLTLSESVPNVDVEINTESSNNILKQGIDYVGEIFDLAKNIIKQNISSQSDNNNSNGESTTDLQIPNLGVKVEVTSQNTSPNETAIDIGNIFNVEQQGTLNEVTSLSTEQSVKAETTIQEASTSENILENTVTIATITVPEEPGAVIIDVLKQ